MSTPKDPVADKSTFLCMYMSNHPDTLVAYVKHWGRVQESVASARMTSIDSNAMTLEYTTTTTATATGKAGAAKRSVRVPFDPPLAGYEEVKPRLLGMTADAQEALGMTKRPQLTAFAFPPQGLTTLLPLLFLVYCTLSARLAAPPTAASALGLYMHALVGGHATFRWIWVFTVAVHGAEALYVLSLCRKHNAGFVVSFQYLLAALFVGFPTIKELRKKIQTARIDSIMKGN